MRSSIKRVLKIAGWAVTGFLLVAGIALWTQKDTLMNEWEKWVRDYQAKGLEKALKTEVNQLPPVDEVEVYRLSDTPVVSGQTIFHRGYDDAAPLYEAKKAVLKGADATTLANLWRSLSAMENGVMCHEPHHALRFLNHGKQVSQAVICFHCENAEIPCTVFRGGLIMFDTQQPQYISLKKRMEELVGAAP